MICSNPECPARYQYAKGAPTKCKVCGGDLHAAGYKLKRKHIETKKGFRYA